jgi:hypothetical protein
VDWLHGHHDDKRGVAYYDILNDSPGWVTPEATRGTETDWLIMCGTNGGAHPGNVVEDKVSISLSLALSLSLLLSLSVALSLALSLLLSLACSTAEAHVGCGMDRGPGLLDQH